MSNKKSTTRVKRNIAPGGRKGIPKLGNKRSTKDKIKSTAKKVVSEGKDVVKGLAKAAGVKKKNSGIKIQPAKKGEKHGKIVDKRPNKGRLQGTAAAGGGLKSLAKMGAVVGGVYGAHRVVNRKGVSRRNKERKTWDDDYKKNRRQTGVMVSRDDYGNVISKRKTHETKSKYESRTGSRRPSNLAYDKDDPNKGRGKKKK